MMSKEINRLHPVSAIITSVKALKSMILPIVIIIISNGFNFSLNFRSEHFLKPFYFLVYGELPHYLHSWEES